MWLRIYLFEIRYWLRSWLLWIFLLTMTGISLWCCSSRDVMIGRGNCDWNAGFVIQEYYAIFSLLTLLMSTVFVSSAANRDFASRTDEIVFSTPITKFDYLIGRFFGAATIAFVPTLGVSLGILAGKYAPWAKDGVFQPVNLAAHWNGILLFAIPNALFMAAILFAVGVVTRSSTMSFVSAICVLTGWNIATNRMQDLKDERIAALLDPFGTSAFRYLTQYWTSADKNKLILTLHGMMLWNRLLWLTVGLLIFAWAYHRFRFTRRVAPSREPFLLWDRRSLSSRLSSPALHPAAPSQFLQILNLELRAIFKTITFLVLLLCCVALLLTQLISKATEGFGNTAFPVTYKMVELAQAGLFMFGIVIALHFAGVVVWREKDSGTDEILDALPIPEWLSYVAKLCAVVLPMFLFQLLGMLAGVLVQVAHGYYRFQPDVYLIQLLGIDLPNLVLLAILAFFCHVVAPHKYAAYFLFPLIVIADEFIWKPLNVGTLMVKLGDLPSGNYSDFFGWAPYRAGMLWFSLYWLAFEGLLAIATILLWRHGRETRWRHRFSNARLRLSGRMRHAAILNAAAFVAIAAFLFYNTKILHELHTERDEDGIHAAYEKAYKRYQNIPQPRVTSMKYSIDLDPATSSRVMRCDEVLQNKTPLPIQQLHLDYPQGDDVEIALPGGRIAKDDVDLGYRIYHFTPPLQPGESRVLSYVIRSRRQGFENGAGDLSVVSNGTFFNNQILRIGYQKDGEVEQENRYKYGLGDKQEPPEPRRDCTTLCATPYFANGADWVDIETVISTAPDQIAVAPGSLLKEWRANGRRYFQYKLDHPSMAFASFTSATYTVSREKWNGIDVEVYSLREHPWNVPRMRESIRKSLDYYIHNFGPYPHQQARIVEFPRTVGLAQAFPGTMPYSESIGFIANLEDPEDIDQVFYVVAHEMAHQWWGHQVVGAEMRGATLLSESLAQYSALMVMEKQYGEDMIRKFLRYENDNYLKGRALDKKKESPLLTVRDEQGYIRYNKASVVLYQLRQRIGEEPMNRALRKLLARYGYAPPPYPTSYALVDALRDETPAEYRYLICDLFEDITLFHNHTLSAQARKRPDGRYDVTVECVVHKLKVDQNGNENDADVNDWIDIGAFGEPPAGKRYGKLLGRHRVHFGSSATLRNTFVVNEKPATAGLDPLNLLIEKSPDDTMRRVD